MWLKIRVFISLCIAEAYTASHGLDSEVGVLCRKCVPTFMGGNVMNTVSVQYIG